MTYNKSSDLYNFNGRWIASKPSVGRLAYNNGDFFMGLFRDGRIFNGTLTFCNGGDLLDSK
jgi:hypothetical protein